MAFWRRVEMWLTTIWSVWTTCMKYACCYHSRRATQKWTCGSPLPCGSRAFRDPLPSSAVLKNFSNRIMFQITLTQKVMILLENFEFRIPDSRPLKTNLLVTWVYLCWSSPRLAFKTDFVKYFSFPDEVNCKMISRGIRQGWYIFSSASLISVLYDPWNQMVGVAGESGALWYRNVGSYRTIFFSVFFLAVVILSINYCSLIGF